MEVSCFPPCRPLPRPPAARGGGRPFCSPLQPACRRACSPPRRFHILPTSRSLPRRCPPHSTVPGLHTSFFSAAAPTTIYYASDQGSVASCGISAADSCKPLIQQTDAGRDFTSLSGQGEFLYTRWGAGCTARPTFACDCMWACPCARSTRYAMLITYTMLFTGTCVTPRAVRYPSKQSFRASCWWFERLVHVVSSGKQL